MPTLTVDGHSLEIAWHGAGEPALVFLHEGLGSVSLWRDFPAQVAAATGQRAFVYSRLGYGQSDPITPPRPLSYMHDEAALLPAILDAAGIGDAILVGHSDGASIALIHAATGAPRIRGLVLLAPHVFVEDLSIASIDAARIAYQQTDLRARLARHHADVDGAFWGWNRAWLDPDFRAWNLEAFLPAIRVPTLIIQGKDDAYGTLAQVDAIARGIPAPVTTAILDACGHSPHRDQPQATLAAITTYSRSTQTAPSITVTR